MGTLIPGLALLFAGLVPLFVGLPRGHAQAIWSEIRRPTPWLIGVASLASGAGTASAYAYTDVATVTFLALMVPVAGALLAPLFGERFTAPDRGALAVSLLGAALISLP